MLFIPFPFAAAMMLLVLFAGSLRRSDREGRNVPFLALILLAAVQSVLLGLRWGYGITVIMYVLPVTAALVPPLAYSGVARLVRRSTLPLFQRLVLHGAPAALIALLFRFLPMAIDVALVTIFLGYAVAILRLMRQGTDALRLATFEDAANIHKAILFAAAALIFSALVDTYVALDFTWLNGGHAISVITGGNIAVLIVLAIAAFAASHSPVAPQTEEPGPSAGTETAGPDEPATETAADREIMSSIEALMQTRALYRDANLTLDRLARRAAIPARQISGAINRTTGKNVSQYVNEFRIAEACQLLHTTDKPVTAIMFEAGFQTKSNFNREFRRVTGLSPVEWRQQKSGAA
ncbi:helix-turn-helix domain-containing protein [Pannonibacter phragmitetus]|uniref:helix-turn-helix domain-containing protein n=1 Tax=Pannonibacter phragmitetus TaxID=121719 RepID=UPI003D2F4A8C